MIWLMNQKMSKWPESCSYKAYNCVGRGYSENSIAVSRTRNQNSTRSCLGGRYVIIFLGSTQTESCTKAMNLFVLMTAICMEFVWTHTSGSYSIEAYQDHLASRAFWPSQRTRDSWKPQCTWIQTRNGRDWTQESSSGKSENWAPLWSWHRPIGQSM